MHSFTSISDPLAVPEFVVNIAVLLLTGGALVVAVLSARKKKKPSFRPDSTTPDPSNRMAADKVWPERNFNQGDDIRLDLRSHRVTFEWQGVRSRKRGHE